MAAKPLPDADLLRQLLRYDPESGCLIWKPRPREMFSTEFKWRAWNTRCSGKIAGVMDPIGYRRLTLLGRQWLAHRLIWKLVTGEDPCFIDHINGDRADNRFQNLRNATAIENAKNQKLQARSISGCTGVVRSRGKWLAHIRDERKQYIRLGLFERLEDAIRARKAAERRLGFHPNHGRKMAQERK